MDLGKAQSSAKVDIIVQFGVKLIPVEIKSVSAGIISEETYTVVDNNSLQTRLKNDESVDNICTSLVDTKNELFKNKTDFNGVIYSWDVSSVKNMGNMFFHASSVNGDISKWDISAVTDMRGMFASASVFSSDISNWDVSSITILLGMFLWRNRFQWRPL